MRAAHYEDEQRPHIATAPCRPPLRVPASAEKPHGLDYSLTLHGPDGEWLVGFDNAHPVARRKRASRRTIAAGCERSRHMTSGTRRH
jgi:hypothetical protein